MSASYNPLQTEDQQIEADAAYARRLQAEERRSATTQSPLHDVSEISRNHAAAPQFPKIPSPAKLVEGLSREQTAGAVFAAFVAVKLGLGPAFAQLTCVALGLAVFRVARKVANLDDEGAFQSAFAASLFLAVIIACVGVTVADVCALLALGAAATKPPQSSFTGDALKTVLKAERKATRGPKPRDFWGKLQRKFTSAVDDFFATLQDRAADVRFYDCDLFMVCKVTPPGADPVWLVGAFYSWHNANAVAVYVNRWLADFASAHAAATRRRGTPGRASPSSSGAPTPCTTLSSRACGARTCRTSPCRTASCWCTRPWGSSGTGTRSPTTCARRSSSRRPASARRPCIPASPSPARRPRPGSAAGGTVELRGGGGALRQGPRRRAWTERGDGDFLYRTSNPLCE